MYFVTSRYMSEVEKYLGREKSEKGKVLVRKSLCREMSKVGKCLKQENVLVGKSPGREMSWQGNVLIGKCLGTETSRAGKYLIRQRSSLEKVLIGRSPVSKNLVVNCLVGKNLGTLHDQYYHTPLTRNSTSLQRQVSGINNYKNNTKKIS